MKEPIDCESFLEAFSASLRDGTGRRNPGSGIGRMLRLTRAGAGIGLRLMRGHGADASLNLRELASYTALIARIGELKGLPMKMGQILGFIEGDLPEHARRLFALLQTQSPATPFDAIETVVREDLGDRSAQLLAEMDRAPYSVASIGQVHRTRLPSGERVAVKVRHPGIEKAIRSDFEMANVGSLLSRMVLPSAGGMVREFIEEASDRLLEECDYALEANRQELFGQLYSGHSYLIVPSIHREWCGPRVLTTSWEPGEGLDAFVSHASQEERNHAGSALFELYIGTLYRHGVFHADPHPGNYHFRAGGQVVAFDYGCVRHFEPEAVRAFVALAEAVRDAQEACIRDALTALGAAPPTNARSFARIIDLLKSFFGPMLRPGAHVIDARISLDMRRAMNDKIAIMRMRLPGRLLFLFRIRFGLYSVLSRLGACCDWSALEATYANDVPRAEPLR